MRMAFYAPFKPLSHPRLSGDVTIARDLYGFFESQGHRMEEASRLTSEWIYWRPASWPGAVARLVAARRRLLRGHVEALFTYHSYYRAPDLLGPIWRSRRSSYFIFAGAYATKRRRRLKTWPGFMLNRWALLSADHVFANKREDYKNLMRLLPAERLSYLRPGIRTRSFRFSPRARWELRKRYGLGDAPTVACAAMLRPGVKAEGVTWTIRACGELVREGLDLRLIIAGDGPAKPRLVKLARSELGDRAHFCGVFSREDMPGFYSAGDVFVFPGINEGLGMAYLEAQCCGLPAVAWDHDGAPEVIRDQATGYITPSFEAKSFTRAVGRLLQNRELRRKLGRAAKEYVRAEHDLFTNYRTMEQTMLKVLENKKNE
jgi:phosphatidylinositol alpha-1,6-mannosyltransferase